MPWKPGESGNPEGKKKRFNIKDYLTKEDVEGLVLVAYKKAKEGNNDMIKFLLEQALGKAPQSMDVTSGGEQIIPIYGGESIPKHASDQEDIQSKEEDKSDSGGN